MNISENDPNIEEAVRRLGASCRQMLPGGGYCGKLVTAKVVNHPNLVCDRIIVATCTDGHKQNTAVLDDNC